MTLKTILSQAQKGTVKVMARGGDIAGLSRIHIILHIGNLACLILRILLTCYIFGRGNTRGDLECAYAGMRYDDLTHRG